MWSFAVSAGRYSGEPRLLAHLVNERLRHSHPDAGMLTMPLRPALAAFRLPSRTVAAQPTCAAQVAADMVGNLIAKVAA
jgi:hypothetical protein